MKPEPEDKRIQKLYREILSEGINPAELRAEKKAFISLYFPKKPFFVFSPMWTPAMAFAVAAFAVFVVRPELFINPGTSKVEEAPAPAAMTAAAPDAAPAAEAAQTVSPEARRSIAISHVSSEAGPTVVYQKQVENVPVAVVWVFPKAVTA